MNKKRKERFIDVINCLEDAKAELYDIQEEENDAFEALSEGLQSSAKGESMQEWIDLMYDISDSIDTLICDIENKIKAMK